ncbi:MAG: DUF3592 domain-containing protein [Chitinophagales bacterium]|nr:DUF3592 domain-containing protein [Chitinophagales bacterium]
MEKLPAMKFTKLFSIFLFLGAIFLLSIAYRSWTKNKKTQIFKKALDQKGITVKGQIIGFTNRPTRSVQHPGGKPTIYNKTDYWMQIAYHEKDTVNRFQVSFEDMLNDTDSSVLKTTPTQTHQYFTFDVPISRFDREKYKLNDYVTLKYLPDNPELAVLVQSNGKYLLTNYNFLMYLFSILGIIALIISVFYWLGYKI